MKPATAFLVVGILTTSLAAATPRPGDLEEALRSARWEKEHECTITPISCGQTILDEINGSECDLGGGEFVDFYRFPGSVGQRVTVEVNSTQMDPFVGLLDPTPDARAGDDDSGPGTDAFLEFVLDEPGNWTIGVSNALPFDTGVYFVTLECPTDPPPPPPPPDDPPHPNVPPLTSIQYPDFRFWVEIADARIGTHGPSCLPETVCVAGAISTRAEVFLRIVGPKPNGRLWPNIIKFNTTKTEVWIEQISTGIVKYYLLPNLGPESDTLPGIVDKNGFVP
jgi:hypothetical protein